MPQTTKATKSMLVLASLAVFGLHGCMEISKISGCQTDQECRADRICVDGFCQAPPDRNRGIEPVPPPDTQAVDTDNGFGIDSGTSRPDTRFPPPPTNDTGNQPRDTEQPPIHVDVPSPPDTSTNADVPFVDVDARPLGNQTCYQVTACIQLNCPNRDKFCVNRHLGRGDKEGRYKAKQVLECSERFNCNDPNASEQCAERNCAQEYDRCASTPGPNQQDLRCHEIMACLRGCSARDQSCSNSCLDRAAPTARRRLQRISRCGAENCQSATDTLDCIRRHCASEYNTCLGCR